MIIELLTEKGFVEGLDFSYSNGELVALERTRDVEQEIEHPMVPAVLDAEGQIVTPEVPAYVEVILVQETYTVQLPSLAELKLELVKRNDPALLINEYLKGKSVQEDDSLNVDMFLAGQNGWRFASVPAPSMDELFELITQVKVSKDQKAINVEALKYLQDTDYMVLRHRDQQELGITPSMSAEEFQELLMLRQAARSKVVR